MNLKRAIANHFLYGIDKPDAIGFCAFCGEPALYLALDGTKVCEPCSKAYKPDVKPVIGQWADRQY